MNRANLVGRLTRDPELRYIQGSGTAVVKATIAVDSYDYKNKKKTAQFIPISVFGKAAENLAQYQSKGSLISVTGEIRVYNYEKDGVKKYGFEVVADFNGGISYLSSKSSSNRSEGQYNGGGYNQNNNYNNGYNQNNNYNNGYNQNNQGYGSNGYNSYGNQAPGNTNYGLGTTTPVPDNAFDSAFGGFGDDFSPVDDGDVPF